MRIRFDSVIEKVDVGVSNEQKKGRRVGFLHFTIGYWATRFTGGLIEDQ
jgi:hypothetical protein